MASNEQRAWMADVFGLKLSEADERQRIADFTERLNIVLADVKLYGLTDTLAGPVREAAEATKARSPDAERLLDALEQQIAQAATRKRTEGAQKEVEKSRISAKTGVVAFGRARIELAMARGAYGSARTNLEAACSQLLQTGAFINDPMSKDPDALAAVAAVGEQVPSIDGLSAEVERNSTRSSARPTSRSGATRASGRSRQYGNIAPRSRLNRFSSGCRRLKRARS